MLRKQRVFRFDIASGIQRLIIFWDFNMLRIQKKEIWVITNIILDVSNTEVSEGKEQKRKVKEFFEIVKLLSDQEKIPTKFSLA